MHVTRSGCLSVGLCLAAAAGMLPQAITIIPGPRNVKIGGDFDNVATGKVLVGFLTYALLFLVTYLPTYVPT